MMAPGIVLLDLYDILCGMASAIGISLSRPLPFHSTYSPFCRPDQSRALHSGWGTTAQLVGTIGAVSLAASVLVGFARYIANWRYPRRFRRLLPENCAARASGVARPCAERLWNSMTALSATGSMFRPVGLRARSIERPQTFAAPPSPAIGGSSRAGLNVATYYYRSHDLTTASTSTQAAEWSDRWLTCQRTIKPTYYTETPLSRWSRSPPGEPSPVKD